MSDEQFSREHRDFDPVAHVAELAEQSSGPQFSTAYRATMLDPLTLKRDPWAAERAAAAVEALEQR